MKKLLVLAFLFLALPACAKDTRFHRAETDPEKALDLIFNLYDKDGDLYDFVRGYNAYDHEKDKKFSKLFSKGFVDTFRKKEKKLIIESCGGKYPADGLPCDMIGDINLIYCGQDHPDVFYYRTLRSDENMALISYTWPQDMIDGGPRYLMVREKDGWKLAGTSCTSWWKDPR